MIEVHFAHGYLLHSFLSPHSNKRTDEFGGSFENRCRFPMMVFNNMLEAVDGKIPVSIRISADEMEKQITIIGFLQVLQGRTLLKYTLKIIFVVMD